MVIRRSIPRFGIELMGRRPRVVECLDISRIVVLAQGSRTHDDEVSTPLSMGDTEKRGIATQYPLVFFSIF